MPDVKSAPDKSELAVPLLLIMCSGARQLILIELRRAADTSTYRLTSLSVGVASRWACRPRRCATGASDRSTTVSYCESWTSRGMNAVYSAASVSSHSIGRVTSRMDSSTADLTTNGPFLRHFNLRYTKLPFCLYACNYNYNRTISSILT